MRQNKQKVVVIYYANDAYSPSGDDPARVNLFSVGRTLKAAAQVEENPDDQRRMNIVAEKLETEWDRFSGSVRDDIVALSKPLCQKVPAIYKDSVAGFVVFHGSSGL